MGPLYSVLPTNEPEKTEGSGTKSTSQTLGQLFFSNKQEGIINEQSLSLRKFSKRSLQLILNSCATAAPLPPCPHAPATPRKASYGGHPIYRSLSSTHVPPLHLSWERLEAAAPSLPDDQGLADRRWENGRMAEQDAWFDRSSNEERVEAYIFNSFRINQQIQMGQE